MSMFIHLNIYISVVWIFRFDPDLNLPKKWKWILPLRKKNCIKIEYGSVGKKKLQIHNDIRFSFDITLLLL